MQVTGQTSPPGAPGPAAVSAMWSMYRRPYWTLAARLRSHKGHRGQCPIRSIH